MLNYRNYKKNHSKFGFMVELKDDVVLNLMEFYFCSFILPEVMSSSLKCVTAVFTTYSGAPKKAIVILSIKIQQLQ